MEVRVSFVVPVYQSEKYLKDCIDSLLCQDFDERYEILLLDFGSQDSSTAMCRKYEKQHPTIIRFIRCEENYGVSATRNLGILWAQGKYIAFVDSDDMVRNDFLKTLYPLAEKEKADIVAGGYYLLDEKRKSLGHSRIAMKGNGIAFLKKLYTDPFMKTRTFVWGRLFSRDLLIKNHIQFPTDLLSFEDLPFTYKALLGADRVIYIKKPIYFYRQSASSLTKRTKGVLETHLLAFLKGKDILTKEAPVLAKELFSKKRLAITMQLLFDSYLDKKQGMDRKAAKEDYHKAVKKLFGRE